MSKNFRTLLPAPGQQGSSSSGSDRRSDKDSGEESRSDIKRIGTNNACVECRVRKTRCNGERPRCFNCQKRQLPSCVYMERSSRDAAAEVIKILQTLPKNRAYDIVDRLRKTGNSTTALLTVLESASAGKQARNDAPSPPLSALEQELMRNFPVAYPSFQAISSSALSQSNLVAPGRGAWSQVGTQEGSQPTQTGSSEIDRKDPRPVDSDSAMRRDPQEAYEGQAEEENYYDRRLIDLDISHWTNVDIGSTLAAQVITLYLRTDHPLLGIFDPYLFIEDLVQKQDRYCSRFLVSAVLYLGCQMYSAFDKSAKAYVEVFWSETQRLSEPEEIEDSPLSIGALVLMSLSLMAQGKEHAVPKCTKRAAEMGMRLGLLATNGGSSIDQPNSSGKDLRMFSHAAWGIFCWSVLVALFYRQPHVEVPKSGPRLPIPGGQNFSMSNSSTSEGEEEPCREGDLMGSTFHSLCQFWTIIHEGIWIYYGGRPDAPPEAWRADLAEHKFREIIAWTDKLPPSLIRGKESGSHIPVFHIWMHAALLDIVRPFTGDTPEEAVPWKTFVATDSSARNAYTASVNQLKRLVLDYRTNYESSTYSMLWHTGLLYLVNAILESPRDPEWHLYFLLCMYGYESMRRPYSISATIGKALLSMTLRDTNMSGHEAREILDQVQGDDIARLKDNLRAAFMGDLKLAMKDPENASVENLAKKFETFALFNDLLLQDDMDFS